jgi:hypothetical protein
MEMGIECQMAAKTVRYDHQQDSDTIFGLDPLLDYGGSEDWQVVKKVPICPKDWPQNIRHCQDDACVWNIRKAGPLFPLPQNSGSMSATGAGPGFAGMEKLSHFAFGGIYFRPQSRRSTNCHLVEVLMHRLADAWAAPEIATSAQDLL